MPHLILLGDSIFDNGAYVEPGEPDLPAQLAERLGPRGWSIDMRAVDGATTAEVRAQAAARPIDTPAHLVLSTGGNDALDHIEWLEDREKTRSPVEVLEVFSEVKEGFRREYAHTLDRLGQTGQPLTVCTIYNPKFPDAGFNRLAETALSFFNDAITEEALRRRIGIIDLRTVCADAECFANPIEPSAIGGARIRDAIVEALELAPASEG